MIKFHIKIDKNRRTRFFYNIYIVYGIFAIAMILWTFLSGVKGISTGAPEVLGEGTAGFLVIVIFLKVLIREKK